MRCTATWIAFGLSLAAPALLAQNPSPSLVAPTAAPTAARPHKSHKSQKAQKPLVLPPLPSGPMSQMPMDQIPATPAKVSFQNGLLEITAQNSNLGEILRDVRTLTGAAIEIPQGPGANERVVTHLGPGAPRDVLAGLLNGSSFNYVMLGSSSDPNAVASVIISAKPLASGETQTAANVYQNNPAAMPPNRFPQQFAQQVIPTPGNGQPAVAQPAAEADDSKDDEENADDNADDQVQPGQPPAAGANAQEQPSDPNQPNAGPRTPEQILEMLRRQQQPGNPVIPPPQPPQ
jgi:hypothetical protein